MKKIISVFLGTVVLLSGSFSQIKFIEKKFLFDPDLSAVDIGDVNNDGLNDVVVGSGYPLELFIHFQNADSAFNYSIKATYPNSYIGLNVLQIADLNNDSLNDIIIGYSDSISIYHQNKSGGFEPVKSFYSGEDVDGLKTGDLNNDGLKDIAVSHWNDDFINIFYRTLKSTYNKVSIPFSGGGYGELDIKDVNEDGLDDLIYLQSFLNIFYQDSKLGITDSVNTLKYKLNNYTGFNGIGTGDLNNDNKIDIVGSIGGNTGAIVLLHQDSLNNLFNNPVELSAYDIPTPVEIDDLNCDRNNEIIVGHDGFGMVSVYQKEISGIYNDFELFNSSGYCKPYSMATGDINNDNKTDIVMVDLTGVSILYNNSIPTQFSEIDTTVGNLIVTTDTLITSEPYDRLKMDTTECPVLYRYSYEINTKVKNERFQGDSVLIRREEFCNSEYSDTLISNFDFFIKTIIYQDTILINIDTALYNNACIKSSIKTENEIFQMYPNPVKGELILDFEKYSNTKGSIQLFTITGTEVFNEQIENIEKYTIDLNFLAKGIYLVKVNIGGELINRKVIKE